MAVRRNTSAADRADTAVGKAAVDRAVGRIADTVADILCSAADMHRCCNCKSHFRKRGIHLYGLPPVFRSCYKMP